MHAGNQIKKKTFSKAVVTKVPMSLCEMQPFIGDMHQSERHPKRFFWQLYNHLWKINQCLLSHLKGHDRSDAFSFISACQTWKCGKLDFSKLVGSLSEHRPSSRWRQMSP